ncbi:MAG: hypothetical protein Q4F00_14300 [bacterium]|nr:hypothetical protein [bacterium]
MKTKYLFFAALVLVEVLHHTTSIHHGALFLALGYMIGAYSGARYAKGRRLED